MIRRFKLCQCYATDPFEQSSVAEPVDPLQHGMIDRIRMAQGPTAVNHVGLVQNFDGFSQSIIAGVATVSDSGSDSGLGQSPAIPDREVPAVTVADQTL